MFHEGWNKLMVVSIRYCIIQYSKSFNDIAKILCKLINYILKAEKIIELMLKFCSIDFNCGLRKKNVKVCC